MARWLGRAIIIAAVAMGLAMPVVPTAVAQQVSIPQRGGIIAYATAAPPGSLDPHVAVSLTELEVIHHVFETLMAMDGAYSPRPMLAAAVAVGNQARRYSFTLRRGVRFHDGQEMTSADVLASFERYAQVSPNRLLLADVAGYETPDPYTFVVRLKATNALFLDMLTTPTYPLAILPAGQRDKPAREIDIVGTGPFVFDSVQEDSHLLLRRNDAYTADLDAAGPDGLAGRKTVHVDTVRFTFVPQSHDRFAALQDGTADVVSALRPEMVQRLDNRADLATLLVFPFCQLVFVTNAAHGPTTNVLVRQAIRAAVDVDQILAATGQPVRRNPSLVYPASPYHPGDAEAPFYDRNSLDEARTLLKQAGYGGEKLVLQTSPAYSYLRDAIFVLAGVLQQAGMNAEVEVVDWATNSANRRRGKGGWNVTAAGFCTQPLLGPQQWRAALHASVPAGERAVLDAAYARLFSPHDAADRRQAWLAIEAHVLEQAYFIKVADLGAIRGYNARVQGLTPFFFLRFWNTWLNSQMN